MKKLSLLLLTLTVCFFTACHKDIWAELENLDQRVTKLEELCKEMNTNITSLQTIVSVLQSNDFITGIVEIKKNGEVIGYTITFGKHDPITIYHGQDGKDGQNGTDGKDGQDGSSSTPVIGVAQDTDGVYYWTLNGEWLLDDNGNKLPVSGTNGKDGQNGSNGQDGTDGKDGQDGTDGKDGQDGADGKDGVTPQLKIEDGYWYISYDNGATWTQLGKATGEDGKDGADGSNGTNGKDGQDGDSMFQSVSQDENYVYFTLADGTVIKISKGSESNDQPNSEFIFTITYDPNGGEGVMAVDTFYYGHVGNIDTCIFTKYGCAPKNWNTNRDGNGASYSFGHRMTIDKNFTLYAQWTELDSTFSISANRKIVFAKGNLQYHPRNKEWRFAPKQTDIIGAGNSDIYDNYNGWIDLFGWGTGASPTTTEYSTFSSQGYETFVDWGSNIIGNDMPNTWRTLAASEWTVLLGRSYYITIDTISGSLFLPDNWSCPIVGLKLKSGMQLSKEQWSILESTYVVFLPKAGERNGVYYHAASEGYWSSSMDNNYDYYAQRFLSNNGSPRVNTYYRWAGLSVRLVKDL